MRKKHFWSKKYCKKFVDIIKITTFVSHMRGKSYTFAEGLSDGSSIPYLSCVSGILFRALYIKRATVDAILRGRSSFMGVPLICLVWLFILPLREM